MKIAQWPLALLLASFPASAEALPDVIFSRIGPEVTSCYLEGGPKHNYELRCHGRLIANIPGTITYNEDGAELLTTEKKITIELLVQKKGFRFDGCSNALKAAPGTSEYSLSQLCSFTRVAR